MDQFEETVVNPNISLNNFEVKIREPDEVNVRKDVASQDVTPSKSSKDYKPFLLLAILSSILFYQITAIL